MLAQNFFQNLDRKVHVLTLLAGLMLTFGLAACGGQTVNLETASQAAVQLDSDKIPADIKLVSATMLMQAKGFGSDQMKGVTFAPGAASNLKAIGMDYDGFVLKGVNILNYEPSAQMTELAAIMVLEDTVGRRAGVRFLAEYQVDGDGVSIQHASLMPVYTMWPRIEAYVVPFDPAVDQAAVSADLQALYSYAVNNAVLLDQAQEGIGDYDVFMFSMDRSSPTADATGWISQNDRSNSGYEESTMVLDYNGWKVAVVSGQFAPRSTTETLYVKYLHTPGEEAPWYSRSKLLSGVFGVTLKAQTRN